MNLFWVNTINNNGNGKKYFFEEQFLEISSKNKKLLLGTTIINKINFTGINFDSFYNFTINYKNSNINPSSATPYLSTSENQNRIIEIPFSQIFVLIQEEIVDTMTIVPLTFNPKIFNLFVYNFYGPYHYNLINLFNQNVSPNSSRFIKHSSAIPLISACPPNCVRCSSSITCEECLPGFLVLNNTCIKCNSQCKECISDQDNCTICAFESKFNRIFS
jgi:hypothetical protein